MSMAKYSGADIGVSYGETEQGLRYTLAVRGRVDMSAVTADQVHQRLRHLGFDKFHADDLVRAARLVGLAPRPPATHGGEQDALTPGPHAAR